MLKITKRMLLRIRKAINHSKAKTLLSEIMGDNSHLPYPDFLIVGINHIKKLNQLDQFSLNYTDGEWICGIKELRFIINSQEELYILDEIFVEGTYNVEVNQPFIFIDIGMNVGITSLFFANKALCKRVFAFEPFQPTLLMAKKNFAINEISNKIEVNETGLGYPTRTVKINYSEEHKGSVGIGGVAPYLDSVKDSKEMQLSITDVFEALKGIPENKEEIILKIDCEGAEYEILERLNDTNLLDHIGVIMLEWHIKGPNLLKKILLDNGFRIISFMDHAQNHGMLYAFRHI